MRGRNHSFSTKIKALARFIALFALVFFGYSASLVASTGISLVQHRSKDAGTNTTASASFSSPNTSGNFIAVAIRGGLSSSQVFTVKDSNGNIYKKAVQIGFTSSAVTSAVYYAENIKGGANTVTVSMTVSAPLRFAVLEYSGVATSNSLDATAAATGTGTAVSSGNATTTINGDLLFGSASTVDGANYTAGTGYTIRDSVPSGAGAKLITEDGIQTIAGTASATATLASSGNWGALFAAFKPAGGVASPSITSLNPTSGPVSTTVTITGTNFGATQGTSSVTFNGTVATPTSWSNTSIAVSVPSGATTGNVMVTVGGLASNGVLFTVIVPPSITNLSPTFAPLGASVTITGSNFGASQGTSTVTFNGVAATPTSWSTTSITAPVPNGATTGNVVVTVSGLTSNGVAFGVAPSITSISPTSGPIGTSVTITGTSFGVTQGTSTVTFGPNTATPTSWSNTTIVVPVPAGATTGNVIVMVNGIGSNRVLFTVTPVITSLNPTSGPVGTSVTITGNSFGASQGTSTVSFNGTAATPTSWSTTSIVVPVPSAATTGNVVVTVGSLASNGVPFTVLIPPSITSFSPTSGPVGTSITITGTNFGATQGTSSVTFNGISAIPSSWSNANIAVPVPSGATTGNVVVTVGGLASNGVAFTVIVPPSITSLSPGSGSVGTSVTIAGTNFGPTQGASAVTFNGTAATPTTWSSTGIVVPVPIGATTGNVVVTVNGLSSNSSPFTVNLISVSVSPTAVTLGTGALQNFSATLQNDAQNNGVTWSLSGSGCTGTACGSIKPNIAAPGEIYTAPATAPNPSTVTLTATSVTDPTKSGSATITVVQATPPNITGLNPSSGPLGASVTITGTNFGATQGSSVLWFNSTQGVATSWSDTSIVASLPTSLTGNANALIQVVVLGLASNQVNFSITPAPSITSLNPATGPVGSTVTVAGNNFGTTQGTNTVTFNGTPAIPTSWSATSIVVSMPTGTTTGNVVVTLSGVASNGITFAVGPDVTPPTNPSNLVASPSVGLGIALSWTLSTDNVGVTNYLIEQCQGAGCTNFTQNQPIPGNIIPFVTVGPLAPATSYSFRMRARDAAGNLSGYSNVASATTSPLGINFVNPNLGIVGSTVTISGAGFGTTQGASTVTFNGTPANPTSWSDTSITAPVPNGASSGNVVVTTTAGTSNGVPFTIVPNISSLSPTSGPVGSTVTITGTGFGASQGNNTITFNGTTATASWSDTSIVASVPIGATTGNVLVTVAGQASNSVPFTVLPPTPNIVSVSPASGAVGTSVWVVGGNFGAVQGTSTITFNGTAATPTSWIDSRVIVPVPSGATTGNVVVTVGGVASNGLNFTVTPPPTITGMTPSSAVVGGAPLTITVNGKNFVSSSTVQWNGSALATTFLSSTQLQATVASTNLASLGAAKVTVSNANVVGGMSNSSTFFVGTTGGSTFATIVVNQVAKDIVYDPANQVFYLSVPGTASTNPNTIAILDPATATVTFTLRTGNNPNVLAISDDSQFLYAGIDGTSTVQRFILPGLTPDISYPLGSNFFGPFFALDLQVAPSASHTTAVSLGNSGPSPAAQGGVTIFDDATPRATNAPGGSNLFGSIQWGANGATLFASNTETSSYDFYTLTVNSGGVTLNQDFQSEFDLSGNSIHFDRSTNLIYSDDGQVINPATGLPVGNFNATRVMVADAALNAAFFANTNSSSEVTMASFDLTHFTPINSVTLANVTGQAGHLIRWGQNGLAFINNSFSGTNQIVLVGGDFVSAAPPFVSTPPPAPVFPPVPQPNAPTIGSLNPSSSVAGSAAFVLNVTGTQFDPAATVQFNGSALSTTYVSSTQLQALIPASAVASPGTASVVVANPSASGGNSGSATFFVGSTGGTSSAGTGFAFQIINQASKQIVFDAASQRFYLSVPNSAATGNTIAVLDPTTASIVGQQFAGSNPDAIAISDDGQYLYAGIDGSSSVQRFQLPGLATDISYSLGAGPYPSGPFFALDLQVAPGSPHTTAVTRGAFNSGPQATGGIEIFDDALARPVIAKGFGSGGGGTALYDSLQWGANATVLFASNTEDSLFDFYTLSVTASGVSQTTDIMNAFSSFRDKIHFDRGTQLIYADDGQVLNPSTGALVGTFSVPGPPVMVPDSSLNLAFFAIQTGSSSVGIYSFNLSTFAPVSSITIPNVNGNPVRLIRWGQNGLALNTDAGQIVLVGGNFVH